MVTELSSRNRNNATLADILDVVTQADIGHKRRAELASAIRTIGRVLSRPLEQIPAKPGLLRKRLQDVSPAAAGISHRRWANVRSHLRSGLAVARRELPRGRMQPMSPAWSDLFARLSSRSSRMRLTRLFRNLSALGIEPDQVTLEHLMEFRVTLQADPLIKNPDGNLRGAAWVWNAARRKILGWPDVEFSVPSRRRTYTLPWETFSESFQADANRYLKRLSGEDLLEELPFRPVRAATRLTRERQILAAASALVHRGMAAHALLGLGDLVKLENFKDILRFFVERRNNTSSVTIEQLAGFLKSIARHWVRADGSMLEKMSVIIKRISVTQHGMTQKNRERLRAFEDGDNVLALLHLPRKLMNEARSGRRSAVRSCLVAQTAVAIELLLMRPLRIGNLASLELDRHLIKPVRRSGAWRVAIAENDVKNRIDLDHELPAESGAMLEEYLQNFRPLLCKAGNAALFPGRDGIGAKAKQSLASQITSAVHRFTGLKVNPHLFRHFSGLVHLTEHPGEYSIVTQVLGHKSVNTTMRYYTGMEATSAVRHFDKTISDLRAHQPSNASLNKLHGSASRRRESHFNTDET